MSVMDLLWAVPLFAVIYAVQWLAFREADARREVQGESCEG